MIDAHIIILASASQSLSVTIQIDGTLAFASDDLHGEQYMDDFPRDSSGHVFECLHFINCVDITFTSSMEVGCQRTLRLACSREPTPTPTPTPNSITRPHTVSDPSKQTITCSVIGWDTGWSRWQVVGDSWHRIPGAW